MTNFQLKEGRLCHLDSKSVKPAIFRSFLLFFCWFFQWQYTVNCTRGIISAAALLRLLQFVVMWHCFWWQHLFAKIIKTKKGNIYQIWDISDMAGPVVLVTSASGRIGKEVIARLKSLGRWFNLKVTLHITNTTYVFGYLCRFGLFFREKISPN